MSTNQTKWPIGSLAPPVIGSLAAVPWQHHRVDDADTGPACLNGRVEAAEIDIASGTPGRPNGIHITEGDFVTNGQVVVAIIDTKVPAARRRRAEAKVAFREVDPQSARRQRSGSTDIAKKGFVGARAPDHRPACMLDQGNQVRAREDA